MPLQTHRLRNKKSEDEKKTKEYKQRGSRSEDEQNEEESDPGNGVQGKRKRKRLLLNLQKYHELVCEIAVLYGKYSSVTVYYSRSHHSVGPPRTFLGPCASQGRACLQQLPALATYSYTPMV
eukprot:765433-Hanusia_phi.AAC.1